MYFLFQGPYKIKQNQPKWIYLLNFLDMWGFVYYYILVISYMERGVTTNENENISPRIRGEVEA
jgi:hypothetical protein